MNALGNDLATGAMLKWSWQEALEHWNRLEHDNGLAAVADFHAYARCCEVLGDWSLHERVIASGLLRYPEDFALQVRRRYRIAVELFQLRQWRAAYEKFELLDRENPKSWPFSTRYYRWQALYRARVEAGEMSLEELTGALYFKSANIVSRQFAGFDCYIEAADWTPQVKSDFMRIHDALVDIFKHYDWALFDLRGHTAGCVMHLAAFLRENPQLSRDIPDAYLYFFARLLLQHGHAHLYQICRAQFADRIAQRRRLCPVGLPEQLFHITHTNEHNDAIPDTVDVVMSGSEQAVLGRVRALSELYRPAREARAYYCLTEDGLNGAFSAMVKERSVAIVGMADVGLKHGREIDQFDLVIRFNWHPEVFLEAERFGRRSDVSYYGSSNLGAYRAYIESACDLRCVVLEEFDTKRFGWLNGLDVPVRESIRGWSYDSPFMFGAAAAVQRVLMDVLRFRPSRVKIFNTNLYLDIAYPPEYNTSDINMFPAFSVHDPLSNFIFTQKCVTGWGVEVDEVLGQVLSLGADNYLRQLWKGKKGIVDG